MGKAEELAKFKDNMKESVGAGGKSPARPIPQPRAQNPREVGVSYSRNSFDIKVEQLERDEEQPRKEFDEDLLQQLGESLLSRGQLQPILARFSPSKQRWVIVDGERRKRAAEKVGITVLKVQETTKTDGSDIFVDQVVANMLREGLKPAEEARAFQKVMRENGWDGVRLAQELKVSPGRISQSIALLRLDEESQALVDAGEVKATVAYHVVSQVEDPEARKEILQQAAEEKLTRDEVKEVVKEHTAAANAPRARAAASGSRGRGRPPRIDQNWKGKFGGYSIHVEKKRGFDPAAAVMALRDAANEIEAKHLAPAATGFSG